MDQLPNLPKLGFGLMRLPLAQENQIDLPQLCTMVDEYLSRGFCYFDTGYGYHEGRSETALKAAVTDRYPRNSFYVADKLPAWSLDGPEDVQRIFNQQLERTGLDFFDFYLLHAVSGENAQKYEQLGCWKFAQQMKQAGKIRHFGFSFHASAEILDQLLTQHPETEFVQLQLNYADWNDQGVQSAACYAVARRHKVPVMVMEPVKGGTLASLRPELEARFKALRPQSSIASWAMRFAASLEGVIMVLSGMSDPAQMQDNLATMQDFEPLTSAEQACVQQVRVALAATPTVGCTACRYCTEGCPQKIDIPAVFKQYNSVLTYGESARAHAAYAALLKNSASAGACIGCGRCEKACPQHLPVVQQLAQAAAIFDQPKGG